MSSEHVKCVNDILTNPSYQGANRFAPTESQNEQLIAHVVKLMPDTLRDWANVIESDIVDSLFFQLENGGKQRKKDMFQRANIVVKWCKKEGNNIKRIVYMDGHGRFTFTLVRTIFEDAILSERLLSKQLTLCVVDIDAQAHAWHQEFFPKDIACVSQCVYEQSVVSTDFFYLNFCGIGGQCGLRKLKAFVERHAKQTFLVSMSTRKIEVDGDYIPRELESLRTKNPSSLKRVTSGKRFITFWITPHVSKRSPPTVSMTIGELRKYVHDNNIKGVPVYTGGRNRRTKVDIVQELMVFHTQ